jgi:hypothetical protein
MTDDSTSQLTTDRTMGTLESIFKAASAEAPRVLAIIDRNRVMEIWKIYRQGTEYRERETDLPKEIRRRLVNGCKEQCEILRTQLAQQEWGQFTIERHHASRIPRLTSPLGLMMLIPGTLLAAGPVSLADVPALFIVLKSALIVIGSLLALGSGWQTFTTRLLSTGEVPLEALGVSPRALGNQTEPWRQNQCQQGIEKRALRVKSKSRLLQESG